MDSERLAKLAVWLASNLQPGAQPFMSSGLRLLWNPVPHASREGGRPFEVQLSWQRGLAANRGRWEPVVRALECSAYVFLIQRLELSEADLPAPVASANE